MYDTYYAETVDALKVIRFVMKPLTQKFICIFFNVVKIVKHLLLSLYVKMFRLQF